MSQEIGNGDLNLIIGGGVLILLFWKLIESCWKLADWFILLHPLWQKLGVPGASSLGWAEHCTGGLKRASHPGAFSEKAVTLPPMAFECFSGSSSDLNCYRSQMYVTNALGWKNIYGKEMENAALIFFICLAVAPCLVTICLSGHSILKVFLCMLEILRGKRNAPKLNFQV